jgi:hypothetical protein
VNAVSLQKAAKGSRSHIDSLTKKFKVKTHKRRIAKSPSMPTLLPSQQQAPSLEDCQFTWSLFGEDAEANTHVRTSAFPINTTFDAAPFASRQLARCFSFENTLQKQHLQQQQQQFVPYVIPSFVVIAPQSTPAPLQPITTSANQPLSFHNIGIPADLWLGMQKATEHNANQYQPGSLVPAPVKPIESGSVGSITSSESQEIVGSHTDNGIDKKDMADSEINMLKRKFMVFGVQH